MALLDSCETTTRIQAPIGSRRNGRWKLRAIISDIHANFEAFQAVLEDIRAQGADEIVCLGDILGYGPEPLECLALVRRVSKWCILGNHDLAVIMSQAIGFREAAARAVKWHREKVYPGFFSFPGRVSQWRWLESLPASRKEGRVLYVHASPTDPTMEYVLAEDFQDLGFGPSQKAIRMFENFEWVAFCGHSHRPGIATHDFKWMRPEELTNLTYVLPPNEKTLINIGSVGQPRDQNPMACYVLFDGMKVTYRRVAYDVNTTQNKIRQVPYLEDYLADRLVLGM